MLIVVFSTAIQFLILCSFIQFLFNHIPNKSSICYFEMGRKNNFILHYKLFLSGIEQDRVNVALNIELVGASDSL